MRQLKLRVEPPRVLVARLKINVGGGKRSVSPRSFKHRDAARAEIEPDRPRSQFSFSKKRHRTSDI
jgi:hypothetical protein